VHGSGIARRALVGARLTGPPLEAIGNEADPGDLGAVLAPVLSDLSRSVQATTEARTDAPNGAVLRPTIKERTWKP